MFLSTKDNPYKGSIFHMMFNWQRTTAILCISTALFAALLEQFGVFPSWLKFPSFPLAVMGGALGIFVSFRTNSAYQRWWEGRKLWGRLINTSRHICSQALAYLEDDKAKEVVYRQITYVHALRCGLREEDPFKDAHLLRSMQEEEKEILPGSTNLNHALLNRQFRIFVQLKNSEKISPFELQSLDETIRHLLDIQGGCERIKKTPFPPVYGFLATRLTQLFALILPVCIVQDIHWWVIPINLVICMAFQMINEVGRVLENPFTTFWPALPLSAMSLTIERNLRQALNESELPPGEQPQSMGAGLVLM